MGDYIDIKINGKYYIQRSQMSKIIMIDEINEKNATYDNVNLLPPDVKKEYFLTADMQENPDKYFDYTTLSDGTYAISFICDDEIKNLIIPDRVHGISVTNVKSIGKAKKTIERVVFPDTITNINSSLFYAAKSLKEVTLSKNIEKIPKETFFDCENLKKINLENVKNIQELAFFGCRSLDKLDLSNVTTINTHAFHSSNIQEVNLPSIETLCKGAFLSAYKLKEVTLGNNLEYLGEEAFRNCILLREIYIPDKVKSIMNNTFQDCTFLESVKFPSDLETIGSYAFSNTNLNNIITIPPTVKEIGDFAFLKCFPKVLNVCTKTKYTKKTFSVPENEITKYKQSETSKEER